MQFERQKAKSESASAHHASKPVFAMCGVQHRVMHAPYPSSFPLAHPGPLAKLDHIMILLALLQGGSAYAGQADDDKSAHTNGAGGGGNYATKVWSTATDHCYVENSGATCAHALLFLMLTSIPSHKSAMSWQSAEDVCCLLLQACEPSCGLCTTCMSVMPLCSKSLWRYSAAAED